MTKKNQEFASFLCPLMESAHRIELLGDRWIFEPAGLTAISFKLLHLLVEHGPCNPSQLAELANATKSNISQRLAWLESKGFVERSRARGAADRRAVEVRATAAGLAKHNEIQKVLRKGTLEVERHFTEAEKSQYRSFMAKLKQVIQDLSESCHSPKS